MYSEQKCVCIQGVDPSYTINRDLSEGWEVIPGTVACCANNSGSFFVCVLGKRFQMPHIRTKNETGRL